jgi:hypothetical protein
MYTCVYAALWASSWVVDLHPISPHGQHRDFEQESSEDEEGTQGRRGG